MVRRWQQLPLDHALRASGGVRARAQALADETAVAEGHAAGTDGGAPGIPDLGPATALDQLRVTVYDAQQAGLDAGLAARLTALLRAIG